jgi:hypothetical protein
MMWVPAKICAYVYNIFTYKIYVISMHVFATLPAKIFILHILV